MAKGYHVLSSVCRDIRNAMSDAANGSAAAVQLIDTFNELLDILDEGNSGGGDGDEEDDDDGGGDDAEEEGIPVDKRPGKGRAVRAVGTRGGGSDSVANLRARSFSTRSRLVRDARPRSGVETCRIGRAGKR